VLKYFVRGEGDAARRALSPALDLLPQYPRREMARRTVGPRRSESPRTYLRSTRIIGGLSVLILFGAVVWDFANDRFWSRHALFTSLVASLSVVAVTAAVLNEVLERRQRQRWSVLAQYALFDLVRTARLVWTGLLELIGLVPDGDFEDGGLAAARRQSSIRRVSPQRWTKCSPAPTAANNSTC
jgi:hypothetical protein